MKKSKNLALSLSALGIVLAIAGPFLPGGTHLVPSSPPGSGHITMLAKTKSGDILAGTQTGEIWRQHGGMWSQERLYVGGQPVLAIVDEPGRSPIATSGGLYNAPVGAPALEGRVSSLLRTDQGLLAGTASGVRLLTGAGWERPGPEASIYTLRSQPGDQGSWIHAGTVGQGVLSAATRDVDAEWQANNRGLPAETKVFSLATTPGGRLLAGTDQGLYWQSQPGQAWSLIVDDLRGERVLSLFLEPAAGDSGADRLWIGRDRGLYRQDVAEQNGALAPVGALTPADSEDYQPSVGISWIISDGERLLISAGSIYEYGPTQLHGWYWVSIVGVILILAAAWWMPEPTRPPLPVGGRTVQPGADESSGD